MSPVSDRYALSQARAVVASRSGTPTPGDVVYALYSAALLLAIIVVPIVRAIILGLATPPVLAALISPDGHRVIGAVAAALAAGALLVGTLRGPVLLSPFLTEFLAGSGLARSSTLRRPFVVSTIVTACALLIVAGIVLGGRFVGRQADGGSALLFLFGCLAFACLLAALWLVGQSCPRRVTVPLAIGILVSAIVAVAGVDAILAATPWGWLALLWHPLDPGTGVQLWPIIALAISPLVLLGIPPLLNNLDGRKLMAQARRWQSIGTLITTGDVAGAAGVLRAPPTQGRRSRIPMTGPLVIAVLQRDTVAATRFPVRLGLGSAVLVAAGWLVATGSTAPDGIQWLVTLTGALVGYLAVGVWCDGLRNANENAGPTSMYGASDLAMIGSHALTPGLACAVLGSAGAAVAVATGATLAVVPWWVLLAIFTVAVRAFDCAKGPLPISLLMPVVTPLGDASMLSVVAWQSDALVIAVAVGGGLTVLYFTAGVQAVLWLTIALALVTVLALRRIRAFGR